MADAHQHSARPGFAPANPDNPEVEHEVVDAYQQELERSKQPGYVPPNLDHEDMDYDDVRGAAPTMRLRPTGTSH